MNELDRIFVADRTQFNNSEENVLYYTNMARERGGVVRIEDDFYVDGKKDKYGNRVYRRYYYFKNGRTCRFETFRSRAKCVFEPIPS